MAYDGFPGGFHELAWPLAHAAAAGPAPFDTLLVHVPHTLMGAGAGWEHDAEVGALVPSQLQSPSPSSFAAAATMMGQLESRVGVRVPSPPSSQYASCYSTPVGSPSKPVAPSMLAGDAVLAERAARLSCFPPSGDKLSRVASSQSLLGELAGAVQQHASDGSSSDGPCRKRKASGSKSKAKDVVVATATSKVVNHLCFAIFTQLPIKVSENVGSCLVPGGRDKKSQEMQAFH